jgi:hypothetical protein
METVIIFFVLYGLIHCYEPLVKWYRSRCERKERALESAYRQHMTLNELTEAEQQFEATRQQQLANRKRNHVRLNRLGRQLQVAFIQLPQSPDAQRLVSWSNQCKSLPLSFRRRQFSRFRRLVERQIPRWLASGVGRDQLATDLQLVAENLGVAKFEADYMIRAMENQLIPAPDEFSRFEGRLHEIQQDHVRRLQMIRRLDGLDADVREELVEAENQRYRASLFGHDPEG